MKPFDLIIFDCDGVLVDSEHITTRVVATMLQERGVVVTAAELYDALHGRSLAQSVTLISKMLGHTPSETFISELKQRAAVALLAKVKPIAGVSDLLLQMDIPICVASSGEYDKIRLTLGATGLLPYFGANIFSVADVANPKPAPDIYLHAAHQNGVAPHRCAVIEDSPTGVQAGVAAGMFVCGFAAHTSAQLLRDAGAQAIFYDMAQLPNLLKTRAYLAPFNYSPGLNIF